MRAVVLTSPGPASILNVTDVPIPTPREGWVRIRVKAFGLNRSELHTRLGFAEGVTFPRVLGIEAVGVVDDSGGTDLEPGQQVAALMGGMGRTFDGGYAEYTSVPRAAVVPFHSELPWRVVGAIPETLQTAHGSLTIGLDLQPGQQLLIRGGTSALGLATAGLAKDLGATVVATTRQEARLQDLADLGIDYPILDNGAIAEEVRSILGNGANAALELVGAPTLRDTLAATRVHGVVCYAGMLSNQWVIPDFYPNAFIPSGVRLTSYSGSSSDLPPEVLQHQLSRIASGEVGLGPIHAYGIDDIAQAHEDLENNRRIGKLVVLIDDEDQ